MKPGDERGAWKPETALRRLRRCLAFLRSGNFLSPAEQERILKRVKRWKGREILRETRMSSGNNLSTGETTKRDTIQKRFDQFHFDNPVVFGYLVRLTRERSLRGHEGAGLKALWEQLRWHIATGNLKIKGEYKLNNDFTSRYVRMLVDKYPAYRGLFVQRHLRSP